MDGNVVEITDTTQMRSHQDRGNINSSMNIAELEAIILWHNLAELECQVGHIENQLKEGI